MIRRSTLTFAAALMAVAAFANRPTTAAPRVESARPAQPAAVKPLGRVSDFPDWVTSVAYAPDGRHIAAGSYKVVKLFDAKTRQELASLDVPSGFVKGLAFSNDGKLLFGGAYQQVIAWDVATRKPRFELRGHGGYVTGIDVSPDGRTLATSSEDMKVRLWNAADGTAGMVIEGHAYPVRAVAFSPDGSVLATAAGNPDRVTKPGETKLWDVETGDEIATLPAPHKRATTGLAWSSAGRYLATTSEDETISVYEMPAGKALGFFAKHQRPTNCVLFSPDGEKVLSGAGGRAKGDNTVMIWNRADGDPLATIPAHELPVTSIALSPDGRTLVSGGQDKSIAFWNVAGVLGIPEPAATPSKKSDKPAESRPAGTEVAQTEAQPRQKEQTESNDDGAVTRVGIIGLDTSHVTAFTNVLNDPNAKPDVAGFRVVAAYPMGSPDIQSSVSRREGFTNKMRDRGVEIVDSIPALLEKVDVVLLETNDGRPHLEQVLPVLRAKKRVFIDKPITASLADCIAIFMASEKYGVPLFSSSSLRFAKDSQAVVNGSIGEVRHAVAKSPSPVEKTHPDLVWYGIHGVETLFTVMGTGCEEVTRTTTEDGKIKVVGKWKDGRTGVFLETKGYGGEAEGTEGKATIGEDVSYRNLVVQFVRYFKTGAVPVKPAETIEMFAFMEAADESKRQDGATIALETVLKPAREKAKQRLAELEKKQ